MAIEKITFNDKSHVIPYGTREIQIWDLDINEIKSVVNNNADILEVIEANQFTGFVAVKLFADLPTPGVEGIGYYVLDDLDPANNGMWGYDTAYYQASQSVNSGDFDDTDNVVAATQKSTNNQIELKVSESETDSLIFDDLQTPVSVIEDKILGTAGVSGGTYTDFRLDVYAVEPNKVARVKGVKRGNVYLVGFFADEACTQFISVTENYTSSTPVFTDFNIEVPSNALFMAVCVRREYSLTTYFGRAAIENTVYNSEVYNSNILIDSRIEDTYLLEKGNQIINAGFDLLVFKVEYGQKLLLKGNSTGQVLKWMFTTDSLATNVVEYGEYQTINTEYNLDNQLDVPIGANYIAVTQNLTYNDIELLELSKVVNFSGYYKRADYSSNFIGQYISPSTGLVVSSGFPADVEVYDVSKINTLRINGEFRSVTMAYCFYEDEACTIVISKGVTNPDSATQAVNLDLSVPVGAYYVGITNFYDLTLGVFESDYKNEFKTIKFNGDSLTDTDKYQIALKGLLKEGVNTLNRGVGGEDEREIAARQGGVPALVNETFTIPFNVVAVQVGTSIDSNLVSSYDNSNLYFLMQSSSSDRGVNPVNISGIEGTLSLSGGIYYFTRTENGSERVVPVNTQVYFNGNSETDLFMELYYVGTNQGGWSTATELCDVINGMINYSNAKHKLIIGIHHNGGKTVSDLLLLEIEQRKQYGNQYINVREYMVNFGLEDAGITPTAQDEIDMAAGEVPTSLLTDGTHFTDEGYYLLGELIYNRGILLGYWE